MGVGQEGSRGGEGMGNHNGVKAMSSFLRITPITSEYVILLNLTCEFFFNEIKKLAVIEEVLGLGWMNCYSP